MENNKKQKPKTKFFPNIWITAVYENENIIGRTCYINNRQSVVLVTENANTKVINYYELDKICKLNFTVKQQQEPIKISELIFKTMNNFENQN